MGRETTAARPDSRSQEKDTTAVFASREGKVLFASLTVIGDLFLVLWFDGSKGCRLEQKRWTRKEKGKTSAWTIISVSKGPHNQVLIIANSTATSP